MVNKGKEESIQKEEKELYVGLFNIISSEEINKIFVDLDENNIKFDKAKNDIFIVIDKRDVLFLKLKYLKSFSYIVPIDSNVWATLEKYMYKYNLHIESIEKSNKKIWQCSLVDFCSDTDTDNTYALQDHFVLSTKTTNL